MNKESEQDVLLQAAVAAMPGSTVLTRAYCGEEAEGHPLRDVTLAQWSDVKLDLAGALTQWAKTNWPACYAAIVAPKSDDPHFVRKCLADVLRRRIKQDVRYLWTWIEHDDMQVRAIIDFVRRIDLPDGTTLPPGDMSWESYVNGILATYEPAETLARKISHFP